ncbi:MAG: TIR domain-containing protein, partial [Pseudomonadota bacterium]
TETLLINTNLRGSSLADSILVDADLSGANLLEADLEIAVFQNTKTFTVRNGRTNFSSAKNLSQNQVNDMIGDTGVILPDGLVHPADWPAWEGSDEQPARPVSIEIAVETGKPSVRQQFVFLSYAKDDQPLVEDIRSRLEAEGIPCWSIYDVEDNAPEVDWRDIIDPYYDAATAILMFWGQEPPTDRDNKLVYVQLYDIKSPFDYTDIPHDLTNWNGDTGDPRWRRLVSVLRDRLFPPNKEELTSRLADTGPRSAVLADGKIDATDTPPNGIPEFIDPSILRQIFEEIDRHTRGLKERWNDHPPQTSDEILRPIEEACRQAQREDPNWFTWERLIRQLNRALDRADEDAWRGFDEEVRILVETIRRLRRFLEKHPKGSDTDSKLIDAPEIRFSESASEDIQKISEEVAGLVNDPKVEEVFTSQAIDELHSDLNDLRDGLESAENPNVQIQKQRFPVWRYALKGIGGFLSSVKSVLETAAGRILADTDAGSSAGTWIDRILKAIWEFFSR